MTKRVSAFAVPFLLFVVSACLCADEIRPAAILSVAVESPKSPAKNAIDGNPDTYACIYDDTPSGRDQKAVPSRGSSPATGYVVFDLGRVYSLYGIGVLAPKHNCYLPKTFDLLGLKSRENVKPVMTRDELMRCETFPVATDCRFDRFDNGQRRVRAFKPVQARYVVMLLRNAHDSGRSGFFINQFAEITFFASTESTVTDAAEIDGTSLGARIAEQESVDTRAFPPERLQREWMRQDAGSLDVKACFTDGAGAALESNMVRKALAELKESDAFAPLESRYKALVDAKKPGCDPDWKKLYLDAASARRKIRLENVVDFAKEYVFVKHCQLSNQPSFASTAFLSDSVYKDRLGDWRMGSQLCKMSVSENGDVKVEELLAAPEGIIRDPCVSFDGTKILFSMRKSELGDDYHLYEMDLKTKGVTQLTFGAGTADIEPCVLPGGDIVFNSTRCDECVPCWSSDVTNLYRCDAKGRYIRRLAIDQAHDVYPQLTNDGRIVYTRWEYNDRVSGSVHKLFVMNPDGTAQTEYYGNNSYSPRSIIHTRPIPGSSKVMVIGSGHHTDQSGKLMRMDRRKGTQENQGLEFVSPVRFFEPVKDDLFGQEGELFQYPLPIDEDNYIVSYTPEGGPARGFYRYPFGLYWMHSDGRRELLVYDPGISSCQAVVCGARPEPPIRADAFDLNKDFGTFYVQDVYFGPGLEGIPRGTVKKLRVVALSIRAMSAGVDYNQPSSQIHTPVSIGNGSWDVKHILGTVDVEKDGSCYFKVPPRMAVYFQLLDEKGYMVQTMRSWAMVMPGEMFSCVGCHEDKNSTFSEKYPRTIASGKTPQTPVPYNKPGEIATPEYVKYLTKTEKAAYDYLNVNAPQGMDVPQGFSYLREIQPIWDAHCVSCHTGRPDATGRTVPVGLLGDTKDYGWKEAWQGVSTRPWSKQYIYPQTGKDMNPGRDYAESYVNLTNFGRVCFENSCKWITWIPMAVSDPPMVKPYFWGAAKSPLMNYLEPSHYHVQLTPEEKHRVATWIDLVVPYCGSYMEANKWDRFTHTYIHFYRDQCRPAYLFQELKRLRHAEVEVDHLNKFVDHVKTGRDYAPDDFARFTSGGMDAQQKFVHDWYARPETLPIYGIAEGKDARGGSHVKNELRNLALNPNASTFKARSWPHATSNSHFKYLYENSPASVIDGRFGKDGVPAWRPNRRTDLWIKIDFGRDIETERVVIRLDPDKKSKKTWSNATLEFASGHRVEITFEYTAAPQEFVFPKEKTRWVKLTGLRESFPLSDNRIAEIEVWGKD